MVVLIYFTKDVKKKHPDGKKGNVLEIASGFFVIDIELVRS